MAIKVTVGCVIAPKVRKVSSAQECSRACSDEQDCVAFDVIILSGADDVCRLSSCNGAVPAHKKVDADKEKPVVLQHLFYSLRKKTGKVTTKSCAGCRTTDGDACIFPFLYQGGFGPIHVENLHELL